MFGCPLWIKFKIKFLLTSMKSIHNSENPSNKNCFEIRTLLMWMLGHSPAGLFWHKCVLATGIHYSPAQQQVCLKTWSCRKISIQNSLTETVVINLPFYELK
jgi:hypothetical protein